MKKVWYKILLIYADGVAGKMGNSIINYKITDVLGRIMEEEKDFDLAPGKYYFVVNKNKKLFSGVYFLDLNINRQKILRKLIIE